MQVSLDELIARCEDEPIRVPGSVQQHGFFLLVDNAYREVLVASENAETFLKQPLKLVLGTKLDTILGRELLLALESVRSPKENLEAMVSYLGAFRIGDDLFSVMTHCIGAERALEFEKLDRLVGPEMMNSVITNFVAVLGTLQEEQELCDVLSEQIAELTGFDRVMLYSFDEDGHGTVLSEVNSGRLPSYLGLRFPASDIPRQARELYVLNTTRIIPDATYVPSPLIGAKARKAAQIDLSLSVLRSVSPVHLEYMRNMGTAASMSVSIVMEGKLWGLVSCHNAEPKTAPYLIRSACDMLTKMAVTRMAAFQATKRLAEMMRFHHAQRDLLTILASEQDYLGVLKRQTQQLMNVTNASGVAVLVDGTYSGDGLLPDRESLERLSQWLDEDQTGDVFSTNSLETVLPWAQSIRRVASGLLAVRISSMRRRYVLWFRPEVVATVRWAGEPEKENAKVQLTPRSSFDQWKEIVHGKSEPWTAMEIQSASDFRNALITVGLHRAEEAIELGEARFEQLTQALPVKIFATDDKGRLTFVNSNWFKSGLPSTGLWIDQLRPRREDKEMIAALWRGCMATGNSFEAELRLPTDPGGTERWNLVRAVPFQRAGATRAGWVGALIDTSESKERETAIRMAEKLALTGRMTSVIAHEINNPLEAMTNLMFLLRGQVGNEGPALNYIGQVEAELERVSGVTKQTLRWNRESGKPEFFAMSLLVDDVLRLFAGKIRNKGLKVDVAEMTGVEGWGIAGQIRQVLANLISNAIDAAPVGGRIDLRLKQREHETGLAVEDNGSGMSKEVQARIFEPFFSTKGDLGNGLGLYISHEVMERHRGRLQVESGEMRGTTVTMWLPRQTKAGGSLSLTI